MLTLAYLMLILAWKVRKAAKKKDQFLMHIQTRKSMTISYITDIVTMPG